MAKNKILVVDDEEDMAKALNLRLKANGYNVVFASDSVQALTIANQENPDLILLDIMIPGGGGFVVAERLKQSAATHRIPIIFLTGIPGGEERAYKLGASGYVMKPYQPEELMEAIHNALEISRKESGETVRETTGATS
ncbi:MAG TPA: response regulator [Thermodesulfobacteriota bacterium]|jgi:DNA-binding response OmpR family regulator|nr:response regulator [Thermodesulfobacteriota bacterium]